MDMAVSATAVRRATPSYPDSPVAAPPHHLDDTHRHLVCSQALRGTVRHKKPPKPHVACRLGASILLGLGSKMRRIMHHEAGVCLPITQTINKHSACRCPLSGPCRVPVSFISSRGNRQIKSTWLTRPSVTANPSRLPVHNASKATWPHIVPPLFPPPKKSSHQVLPANSPNTTCNLAPRIHTDGLPTPA